MSVIKNLIQISSLAVLLIVSIIIFNFYIKTEAKVQVPNSSVSAIPNVPT